MKIAIDGPAGAGKSTLARRLASRLGMLYIDTGAMYRALTLQALLQGVNLDDEEGLVALAEDTDIDLVDDHGELAVFINGHNVTWDIRQPLVSKSVSTVAAHPGVRKIMVEKQREMARFRDVVMDGRDIGEYVLPDAEFKLFITASLEERARRRSKELGQKGYPVDRQQVEEELVQRDYIDSHREVGALKVLPEAIVIDTSHSSEEEVLEQVIRMIKGEN